MFGVRVIHLRTRTMYVDLAATWHLLGHAAVERSELGIAIALCHKQPQRVLQLRELARHGRGRGHTMASLQPIEAVDVLEEIGRRQILGRDVCRAQSAHGRDA